ncbi:MAG: hypothetical protein MUO21_03815, partial [Nitrososphaeraceae archaeon]|nr:hypothetical protein [Nitrososphaeraceae archaeon]
MNNEYNSVVRNEATTEVKRQKANLFNNSVSYDHLKEKLKETAGANDVNVTNGTNDDGKNRKGGISDADKNAMDEIMKNLDNLKTTETDMLFQYMANPDKLVPKENVQLFEKPPTPPPGNNYKSNRTETDRSRHNTETIGDYVSKNESGGTYNYENNGNNVNNNDFQNTYSYDQQQPPKPSAYGPSYGEGEAYNTSNAMNDQFEGFGSEDELNIAKLNMLRQLGELTQHGVKLSQNYSMRSDYKAMKYENDLHRSIRDKHNGTKWLGNFLLNACWGVELVNENFNPFEFKLKGWSDQMNDDIDEYYDVLGELYEKWFKSGKPIPPEIKLIFMVGGSAIKFHIANTALGKIPTLSEALKQNPALAKKLNEQAVSEKVKEKYEKQREAFEKKSVEQHQNAMKQAEDLQMLKQKEMEHNNNSRAEQEKESQMFIQQQFAQQQMLQQQMMQNQMMQNQILTKQKQLDDLQKQLNAQRSDTRSIYSEKSNNSSVKKTKSKPIKQPQPQPQPQQMPKYYQTQ